MAPPPVTLRIKLRSKSRSRQKSTDTPASSESSAEPEPSTSTQVQVPSTSQPSTSRQHQEPLSSCESQPESFRQQLKKKNFTAYQIMLLEDVERNRKNRNSWSKDRKAKEREKAKFRMRKRRRLQKEAMEAAAAAKASANPQQAPKRQTRVEKLKEAEALKEKQQYNREYQRQRRGKFSQAKKDEINAKRREKARREREELLAHQRQLAAQKEATPERSAPARLKSLSRARAAIPQSPEAYADTVEDLQMKATPKKAVALRKRNLKVNEIDQIIADGLKKRLNNLKRRRSAKDRLIKRELLTLLAVTKKYKQQREACRRYGVSSKNIADEVRSIKYCNPSAIQTYTKHVVVKYYESHSIEIPDKKGISKKTLMKTRVLETPVAALHASFRKAHPNHKMGLTTFSNLRPRHIRRMTDMQFRGCLCEYCENVALKLKAVNIACQKQGRPSCKITDIKHAVEMTMCAKNGKFNVKKCIKKKCKKCGESAISKHVDQLDLQEMATYSVWETTKTGEKKVVRKTRLQKSGTLENLVVQLKKELQPLAQHVFDKVWQQQQFSDLTKSRLPDGWCLMVMDFAENFTRKTQDEVQAAHWTQEQVTVHPIVCYYNCRGDCQKPVMHSTVFISNDLKHDHHAVHAFSTKAIQVMKEVAPQSLNKIIRFTDGCSSQYKSKGPFVDISYAIVDTELPIQHEYFGSRHGKGPLDGESAVVKRMTSMAEASHRASVTCATEMAKFCCDNLTKDGDGEACAHFKRTIVYVPTEEIQHQRGRDGETLKGTRSRHSVKCVKPGLVAARNLSCFCDACRDGFGVSSNQAYVDPWKVSTVQKVDNVEAHQDESHVEDVDMDPASSLPTPSPVPSETSTQGRLDDKVEDGSNEDPNIVIKTSSSSMSSSGTPRECDYRVGDYVAVTYDDTWWVGQVLKSSGQDVEISFLVKKGENKFSWPDKQETDSILKSGVFMRFPCAPVPVSTRYIGFDSTVYNSVASKVNRYLQGK